MRSLINNPATEVFEARVAALEGGLGGGIVVSIAQVRECPVLDLRFVALVHNDVRGAAGAAVPKGLVSDQTRGSYNGTSEGDHD